MLTTRFRMLTSQKTEIREFHPYWYNYVGPIKLFSLYSTTTKESQIDMFLVQFYDKLIKDHNVCNYSENSNVSKYQHTVLNELHKYQNEKLSDDELFKLQTKIENLTTQFDDFKNIYQITPDLIKIMICKDKPSAKDFLKSCKCLSSDDLECLDFFDQYTLEAIMLYVMGILFHCINDNPAVRVSTLVDHLDMNVRTQAKLFKDRNIVLMPSQPNTDNKDHTTGKNVAVYAIGSLLVEFLVARKLIILSNELSFTEVYTAKKNKGKYYYPKTLYATCNFDISLLPIKLNLPMVCKPEDWGTTKGEPKSLSDLRGGYLNKPIGDFYHRYNLLTSRDMIHFHIVFETNYKALCDTMNKLQEQAFEINKDVLNFIKNNYDLLVKSGILMPRFLASLNIPGAINLLRNLYLEDQSIMQVCNFKEVLHEFMVRIQRSRYETFIINLASAYEGYQFYLPAFLDFRGRIYRAGVLHFHERDLARSLIVFSNTPCNYPQLNCKEKVQVYEVLTSAASFHYMKFFSYDDAHQWYLDHQNMFNSSDESLIQFAVDASNPYQFISKVLCIKGGKTDPRQIPITQDASASAYQIMSYLLLDKKIAYLTNLIPHKEDTYGKNNINDIYTYFLETLKVYLSSILQDDIYDIICSGLTRKLIKQLFMPLIYGKTVISMSNDIYNNYSTLLGKKECFLLATHINNYFRSSFPGIVNLMELISNVGWVSAALSKPVFYSIPLLTSVQDYMIFKNVNIWIYDRIQKKRRQVTLRIPTEARDRRKTKISTFANFIHQKDANIAMHMIYNIYNICGTEAPVYTVHDNFITTAPFAMDVSNIYTNIVSRGEEPIYIINYFIIRNLLDGWVPTYSLESPLPLRFLFNILEKKIPKNISKKQKLIWEQKIVSIYTAYIEYLKTTYSIDMENDKYIYSNEWNDFQNNLNNWERYKYNYSLHL